MADILQFPNPLPTDGGKAHIRARRIEIGLGHADRFDFSGLGKWVDELVMDHVDTADGPYRA